MPDQKGVPAHREFVGYLLGRLPQEEREKLEQRFFDDDAQFEAACAAEDDLILAYLRGELPRRRRRLFEREYMTSAVRRSRVELTRSLLDLTRPGRSASRRWTLWPILRPALAALAAVAIVAAGWLTYALDRSQKDRAALQSQLREARSVPPLVPSFLLEPGLSRGPAQGARLVVPPAAPLVRLRLTLPPAPAGQRRRARLTASDGAQIWSEELPSGAGPALLIPAGLLPSGDYILSVEDVETYVFRIVRR